MPLKAQQLTLTSPFWVLRCVLEWHNYLVVDIISEIVRLCLYLKVYVGVIRHCLYTVLYP